jgi:hypothetical protein
MEELASPGALEAKKSASGPPGSQPLLHPASAEPPDDLLAKAESLLNYAAESGIEIKDTVRDGVIKAKFALKNRALTEPELENLLAALTALAATLRPVTAKSLKASAHEDRKLIHFYGTLAWVCGLVILVFSILTFATGSISSKIKTNVDAANALVVKLRIELGPWSTNTTAGPSAISATSTNANWQNEVWFGPAGIPAGLVALDLVSDLQQFTATMREVYGYSRQLNRFVLNATHDPYPIYGTNFNRKLELDPGLNVRLAQELTEKAEAYQQVRYFANTVQERVAVWYGAIATCLLPVLYALLGAVAYLLRLYEDQIKTRTLIPADRHTARFLIAGIGGLVVGLFNNVSEGITISPFALAFLVGYAVDVFFAFLEGLLQMFRRNPANPGSQSANR